MSRSSPYQAVIMTQCRLRRRHTLALSGPPKRTSSRPTWSRTCLASQQQNDSKLNEPLGASVRKRESRLDFRDPGTQTSSLFPGVTGSTGVAKALFTVNIPPAGVSGPTGQVANSLAIGGMSDGFDVKNGGNGKSANFIFANPNGSTSAWNGFPTTQAFTQTSEQRARASPGSPSIRPTPNCSPPTSRARAAHRRVQQCVPTGYPCPNAFATPTAVSAKGPRPLQRDGSWRQRIRDLRAVRPHCADDGHGGPGREGRNSARARANSRSTIDEQRSRLAKEASPSRRLSFGKFGWRPSG